jgi:hypothetical protein
MMNPVTRYTLAVVLGLLLAGCATTKSGTPVPSAIPPEPAPVLVEPPRPEVKPEPLPPPPPPEPQSAELTRLLVQVEAVRKMQAADAAKELEQARLAFSRSRTDYNRLQYAILSLLPNAGGPDEAKASAVLEPMLKDKSTPGNGLRAFAAFLYFQIAENRKMEDRMREEQKRADSLQEKLDALKEVEKNLLDREQSAPRKK